MLDKTEILNGMTEEQKIALVSDVFAAASDALNAVGVPHIERTSLDMLNQLGGNGAYPEFSSLSASWNLKLISAAASDMVAFANAGSLVETPPIYLRTGACATGLSEDPYLVAMITDSIVSAVENAGGAACVSGCGMRPVDAEYLDRDPQENVISDILSRAADAVLRTKRPTAAEMPFTRLKGEWKNINERLVDMAVAQSGARAVIAIDAPEEKFREKLAEPVWYFTGASSSALRSALKNYRRMKEDMEHGAIGADELDKAVRAGTAISAEQLEIAASKALDLVDIIADKSVNRSARAEAERATGARFAAAESIVMLKNDGVLPLLPKYSVGVVGDADMSGNSEAFASAIKAYGASYVGFAAGYKLASERNDELLQDVARLSDQADVIVVFIGFGKKRFFAHESLALPANQAAALDVAVRSGKRVIAVVSGEVIPSMSFDENVSAILTLPTGGAQTTQALFDIMYGAVSPSGKLTHTVYDDPDAFYNAQKKALSSGKYKVGEFIGYRRYTTENTKIKYPFGFGLSYGRFAFSNIKVTAEGVEVTVKNTGNIKASEVVQLYIGKKDSALVRPLRELKGFAKVMLEPGNAMLIKFPVSAAMLEVYDGADGKRKTEMGAYEVYVGTSSTDIKLTATMTYSGEIIAKSNAKLSDYLPSLSNIMGDGYRMSSVASGSGSFRSARPSSDSISYEQLFAEEFGSDEKSEETATVERDEEDDILCFLDDSVTVKTAADGLIRFAAADGFKIDPAFASELIAAFSASRVVLLKCDKPEFDILTMTLCDYFGCPSGIDDAYGFSSPDDLFMGGRSALCGALAFAAAHRENIVVSAFDGVKPDAIGKAFVPFIRYATSPDDMKLTYGANRQSIDVSKNVWFLMRLADEKCTFPAYIADMATVIVPKMDITSNNGDNSRVFAPNYYQLVAAFKRAERDCELDEIYWKKVDRFERYVAGHERFKIDNKMSVQMEKFVAVLLECGSAPAEALDATVAAKLVPYATSALDGKLSTDDVGIAQTLEGVFGEDGSAKSKAVFRKLSAKEGA